MTRKMRRLALAVIVGVIVAAALESYGWYHERYVWPWDIQRQVLGEALGASNTLIEYEGFSHYGQGAFKWRYRLDHASGMLERLCTGQQMPRCHFARVREVSKDVTQYVIYKEGVLIVEEVWS